jgi:hypothetical protein
MESEILKSELNELLSKIDIDFNPTADPPFSLLPLMYGYISSRELMHSDIIAELLSCKTNNYAIMRQFLKDIGVEEFPPVLDESPVIHTEREVESRRRIDILITWGKNTVIIENKLNDAPNQQNQLSDYCTSIINAGYNIKKVVYMPLYNSKSAPYKIGSHDVINFHPKKIIDWLEESKNKLEESTDEWCACKNYSDLLKYINIRNKNFMNATKILDLLENDDFAKLTEIASIVNSTDWYNAILTKISNEVKSEIPEVNSVFKGSNHIQPWLDNYNFWVELWIDKKEIKLWLRTNNQPVSIEGYTQFSEDKNYYINERPIYLYPDKKDDLIRDVIELLKKSISK